MPVPHCLSHTACPTLPDPHCLNVAAYPTLPVCVCVLQLSAHEARASGGDPKGKGKAGISAGPFCKELQAEVRVAGGIQGEGAVFGHHGSG
jgi:hypothetical protein